MSLVRILKNGGAAALALSLGAGLSACSDSGETTGSSSSSTTGTAKPAERHLDPSFTWYGKNAERINAFLDAEGSRSAGYDSAKKPVAVFDWDNTVIKNDVGDATMFWMLKKDKILQPPGKSWAATSPYLTKDAADALSMACGALADEGKPLPTSTDAACADEILSVYYEGVTTGGAGAFEGWNYRTIEPSYAWTVALEAGYTPDEIKGFADMAITEALAAEVGATQTIGSTADLSAYIRIYDPIKDLIGALQADGFDVWVASASSQHIVEPFAAKVGVAADHVIGVRALKDSGGKLTYDLEGCGSVPDGKGSTGNSLITYIDGKRCWINKVVYGVSGADAEKRTEDESKRQVFAAGDSDTDVTFLQDATTLRLVINRNKKELMCNAYANSDGGWIVNPMFIGPKVQLEGGYACSKDACRDKAGAKGPCLGADGKAIADQADTVYCVGGVYCDE